MNVTYSKDFPLNNHNNLHLLCVFLLTGVWEDAHPSVLTFMMAVNIPEMREICKAVWHPGAEGDKVIACEESLSASLFKC